MNAYEKAGTLFGLLADLLQFGDLSMHREDAAVGFRWSFLANGERYEMR